MLYDDLVGPQGTWLCHHGIKGQKWGEKNGPPYPLGSSQKSASEKSASTRVARKSQTIQDKAKKIKDANLLTEEEYYRQRKAQGAKGSKDFHWEGRLKRAADTGLRALNKVGRDGFDEKVGITNEDRWWFICEDQTIGLGTIADLVNRGKKKSDILNLIDLSSEVNHELYYEDCPEGTFQLAENKYQESTGWIEKYIDACIDNRS